MWLLSFFSSKLNDHIHWFKAQNRLTYYNNFSGLKLYELWNVVETEEFFMIYNAFVSECVHFPEDASRLCKILHDSNVQNTTEMYRIFWQAKQLGFNLVSQVFNILQPRLEVTGK